jgi:hypothetical protein
MDILAELPISTVNTSQSAFNEMIPTYDAGLNVVSNGNLLDSIASFASKIGSTATGVLNNIRFGTGPGGVTPVAAQPQAVAGSLSIGTILLIAVAAYFLFFKK